MAAVVADGGGIAAIARLEEGIEVEGDIFHGVVDRYLLRLVSVEAARLDICLSTKAEALAPRFW